MGKVLFFLSWFFLAQPYVNADSHRIFDDYFTLEGSVASSCSESLKNSLSAIPQELRRYLIKEIQRRKSKYIFKRVSFEFAKKGQFSGRGGMPGVPAFFAGSHTIYHVAGHCARQDSTITHEIGHLIHSSIRIHYPAMANQWEKLWNDIFEKQGSPKNPLLSFPCPLDNCPFINRKGAVNVNEGFAELIVEGSAHRLHGKQNRHPDYLRQMRFLQIMKRRQQ